jgi:putative transposase
VRLWRTRARPLAVSRRLSTSSAAQRINRALGKHLKKRVRGKVFSDRYHATILTTPRQVRHALAYVLNNWRRHGEDRRRVAQDWTIDLYASGAYFDGWKERPPPPPATDQALFVRCAKSWLLTIGWRKHGLVSFDEVPKGAGRA